MEKPLVSIITPSYNQGKYIRETIKSVLAQDYEKIEYIIVDGGSTDNTLDIIKEYEGRLKYISEKDEGQSDAINKGFHMAKGEIIAWLNSDDIYEMGCVKRAVKEFSENKNIGLVYADGYVMDDSTKVKQLFPVTRELDLWILLYYSDYIMQPTTFFRKACLDKVGYLDKTLNWVMDWDLWIRLSQKYDVKYINQCFATTREYGETKTSMGGAKRIDEIERMLSRYSNGEEIYAVHHYRLSDLIAQLNGNSVIKKIKRKLTGHEMYQNILNMPVRCYDNFVGKRFDTILSPIKQNDILVVLEVVPEICPIVVNIMINKKNITNVVFKTAGEHTIRIAKEELTFGEITRLSLIPNRTIKSVEGKGYTRYKSFKLNQVIFDNYHTI